MHEDEHGKGYGKMLINVLTNIAVKNFDVDYIELTNYESRKAARALYKKDGFRIESTTLFCKKINEKNI